MPAKMTPKERIQAAINLEEPDRTPVNVSFTHWVPRHYGYTIAEYMFNPALQIELMHRAFEELGGCDMPMFRMISGPFIDPVMGYFFMPVKLQVPGKDLPPNSIPQFVENEVMVPEDYDTLINGKDWKEFIAEDIIPRAFPGTKISPPQPPANAQEDELTKRNRIFLEEWNIGVQGPGGMLDIPFELFSYTRSMDKLIIDLYRIPEKVAAAMDALMPRLLDNALSNIKGPGGNAMMAMSRCAGNLISPKLFEKFVFPYAKKAVEEFISRGCTVSFHLDNDWTNFLPYFRKFPEGRYVLQFDSMTDIFKAKEIIGDRMCIQGDVPASLFKLGTPEEVEAYCQKRIDIVGNGGGYIVAAGCEVPADAKFENIKAMVDTAKNYPNGGR